jgi:hypothetical protein
MGENFSPVIFLYGMALVLAVGKAFTLTIWRVLPKGRPGLRQEILEAWRQRRARKQVSKTIDPTPQSNRQTEEVDVQDPRSSASETLSAAPARLQSLRALGLGLRDTDAYRQRSP